MNNIVDISDPIVRTKYLTRVQKYKNYLVCSIVFNILLSIILLKTFIK